MSQIWRQYERRRHELVDMRTVYVWYCGRCSSPLDILRGEFALYQKSSTTNDKAVVRRVTKVDHRSKPRLKECQKLIGIYISWQRTSLLRDKAIQLSTAKACVFSDSVFCLCKMYEYPKATDARKEKIEWITFVPQYRELDRVDGEPMEFEWPNFPGCTTLLNLAEIQKMMGEMRCEPKQQFTGRIFFITMTLYGEATKTQHRSVCVANSMNVAQDAKRFPYGHWSFLGPGSEEDMCLPVKYVEAERRMERCR